VTKVDHIAQGSPIPEWFLDALQEFTSTMVSGNFVISQLNTTTLQVVAGTNSDQVSIGIVKSGQAGWRYITATVTAAVPGGLPAGTHDIYVTAHGNGPYVSQTGPPSVLDQTNYAFGLKLVQSGTTPSGVAGSAEELYRLVGHFTWDGTQITGVSQTVGAVSTGSFAPINSPAFTGTPTAPTPPTNDNSTRLATTAWFVAQGIASDASVVHIATAETITGVKTFSAAPLWDRQSIAATATLAVGSKPVVLADTTTAAFTINLPATPTAGAWYTFIDVAGQWGTRNLTIGRNGKNINGAAANLVLAANYSHVTLYYDGTGWQTVGFSLQSPALAGTPTAATAVVDTNTTQIATTAFVLAQASSTPPLMDGTAAVGTSTRYARADHVHGTDTTRAPLAGPTFTGSVNAPTPATGDNSTLVATTAFVKAQAYATLASPTFTGTPAAPTAAVDTNTTQIATTAFVLGQAAAVAPLMDGVAAVGTSTRFARADHVHPIDTSRAPLASPTFTGTPAAPTPATGDSSTRIATTAYVQAQGYAPLVNPTFTGTLNAPNINGTNAISVIGTGGLGYSVGAGGTATVTQANAFTPGVTVNAPAGVVTITSVSVPNNTGFTLKVTNNTIGALDGVVATIEGAAAGALLVSTGIPAGGTAFYVALYNVSGTTVGTNIVVNFQALNGANS
jgi:hypothetical protein